MKILSTVPLDERGREQVLQAGGAGIELASSRDAGEQLAAARDAEVIYAFKGQPRDLSVDLQLVAYRCICHAFALLSECQPDEYRIKMRVWQGRQRRGIVLFITTPNAPPQTTQAGVAAAALLNARVKAHGGGFRRAGGGGQAGRALTQTPLQRPVDCRASH